MEKQDKKFDQRKRDPRRRTRVDPVSTFRCVSTKTNGHGKKDYNVQVYVNPHPKGTPGYKKWRRQWAKTDEDC